MFIVIAGVVIVGAVGLAALYDYFARRRGENISISASGPMTPTIDPTGFHEDAWTGRPGPAPGGSHTQSRDGSPYPSDDLR